MSGWGFEKFAFIVVNSFEFVRGGVWCLWEIFITFSAMPLGYLLISEYVVNIRGPAEGFFRSIKVSEINALR